MRNAQMAPPGYVLPKRPGWQGGWNFKAVCGAVAVFVLTASATTEWLAVTLGNPVEMGEPLISGALAFSSHSPAFDYGVDMPQVD